MTRDRSELRSISYHEAGHACAARLLGVDSGCATIVTEDPSRAGYGFGDGGAARQHCDRHDVALNGRSQC